MKPPFLLFFPIGNNEPIQVLRRKIMRLRELLISEINEAPEPLLSEVLDFVQFLRAKTARENLNITVMSESALRKDWLKPEEDEAWQNL